MKRFLWSLLLFQLSVLVLLIGVQSSAYMYGMGGMGGYGSPFMASGGFFHQTPMMGETWLRNVMGETWLRNGTRALTPNPYGAGSFFMNPLGFGLGMASQMGMGMGLGGLNSFGSMMGGYNPMMPWAQSCPTYPMGCVSPHSYANSQYIQYCLATCGMVPCPDAPPSRRSRGRGSRSRGDYDIPDTLTKPEPPPPPPIPFQLYVPEEEPVADYRPPETDDDRCQETGRAEDCPMPARRFRGLPEQGAVDQAPIDYGTPPNPLARMNWECPEWLPGCTVVPLPMPLVEAEGVVSTFDLDKQKNCEEELEAYRKEKKIRRDADTEARVVTKCSGEDCPKTSAAVEVDEIVETVKSTEPNLAVGFRKLLAQTYQNCDVLDDEYLVCPYGSGDKGIKDQEWASGVENGVVHLAESNRVLVNVKKYVQTHPYLKNFCDDSRPECKSACETPPIFNFGATRIVSGGELKCQTKGGKTKEDKSNRPIGYGADCTEDAAAGAALVGMLPTPVTNQSDSKIERAINGIFTGTLASSVQSTCFVEVEVNETDTAKEGDLLVVRDNKTGLGHAVVIDSFDSEKMDLFFEKGKAPKDCSTIKISDAKFRMIQTGAIDDIGMMRVHAKHYLERSPVMTQVFEQMGQRYCELRQGNNTGSVSDSYLADQTVKDNVRGSSKTVRSAVTFKMLRLDSSKDDCKLKEPLKMDDPNNCVKDCNDGALKKTGGKE
ncbi:MAG: hypothetical protein COT74_06050 [Bdellovibrionales bacterium CG10_big_fil_rev_8_21_14_0_10_45_34]|nr:MAG: hypothetical protein COT74_06050 [Bdellovibrionales bacterium CG10_big_fil_rev_8_21_14_0_10_45_34]